MLANILNSIVNNSSEIYDNNKPYSFIKFLNFYEQSIDVKIIINEYNEYIQQWYIAKNNQVDVNLYKQLIQQQYFALLQEISIDYTTAEEKRFLSQLTLTEEIVEDSEKLNNLLDIVLPFYIRKINNICNYYLDKRNELKLNVNRLLDINTINDAKKTIKNLILDEITTNNAEYSIDINDVDDLRNLLEIEIDELYDHNDYFEKNNLSSYNNNDINYKAFYDYDNALIDAIRQYPFFLIDNNISAFSINPKLTTNDINYLPLHDFIDNAKSDNKNDVILELQKTLVEKYSGTDYYYLSTNSNNEPISGILATANDSVLNILNNDLLNTPTIEYEHYDDIRRIGINFKPDKFGLLFYNTNNLKYEINTDKLTPNSVYVFPNPNKYTKHNDIPLIWTVNNDKNKLNYSSQYAYGSPKTDPLIQYFYSYFSIEQQQDSLNKDKIVFHGFEEFIGDRTITRSKFDIYGNEYVLLKNINYFNNHSYYTEKNINKILNGNLDNKSYYTSLPINIELSSIYYYTLPMGGFINNNFEYETNFYRKFNKNIDGYIIDVTIHNLSSYNTNAINWPYYNNISYDLLIDGGASNIVDNNSIGKYTIQVPINDNQLSSCNFQYSEQVGKCYDGGAFYTTEDYVIENIETKDLTNTFNISSNSYNLYEKNSLSGDFYVKNINTGEINKASESLSAIYSKYNIENEPKLLKIYDELQTNIEDIDVINDIIFITTKNYIIYDKIVYENNFIVKSQYNPSYIERKLDSIEKPSTYFYIESLNKVVYVEIYNYSTQINNDGLYYGPVLKLINLNDLNVETIKIENNQFIIDNFNWGIINHRIINIDTPVLTYNSLNNLYNVSILCRDIFDLPYLYNISFINKIDYIIIYSNDFYDNNIQTKNFDLEKNIDVLYNFSYQINKNKNGDYIIFK